MTKLTFTGIARPLPAHAGGRACGIIGNRGYRDEREVWTDEAPLGRFLREGKGDRQAAESSHQQPAGSPSPVSVLLGPITNVPPAGLLESLKVKLAEP